jgi:hypothetical protein
MSWNKDLVKGTDDIYQYGSWLPWEVQEEEVTLRRVLEHMLSTLPQETLNTLFSQTDMTFISYPPRTVPAGTASYEDPLGKKDTETHYDGFTSWKVWYKKEKDE